MKKMYFIWIFFMHLIFAQTTIQIRGTVLDKKSLEPIPFVDVYLEEISLMTHTNEKGEFSFSRIPNGFYTIHFYRIGYQEIAKTIRVQQEQTLNLNIMMMRSPLSEEEITVTAPRDRYQLSQEGLKLEISVDSLNFSGNQMIHLLQKIPGITILKNDAGQIKIMTKGSIHNFVKVLVNGVDISNPQTGEFDLSIISDKSIQKIEFYPVGNSGYFGSGSIAGVINIIIQPKPEKEITISSSYGSFKHYKNSLNFDFALAQSKKILFNLLYNSAKNNFSYKYQNQNHIRKNNNFIDRAISLSGDQILNFVNWNKLKTSTYFYYTHRNHHLPGASYISNQPESAHSIEDILIASQDFSIKWNNYISLRNTDSYKYYKGIFDGSEEIAFRYLTFNWNHRFEHQTNWTLNLSKNLTMKQGFRVTSEKIKVRDEYNPFLVIAPENRTISSGYLAALVHLNSKFYSLNINISGQYLNYKHYKNWYPFLEMTHLFSLPSGQFQLTTSYAENFKLPDMNSLYWVSSASARGNPQLLPELGITRSLRLSYEHNKWLPILISGDFFNNHIWNYILWQPDFRGVWSPSNQGRMQLKGYAYNVELHFGKNMNVSYDYYHQNPINFTPGHNSYGKKIPFVFRFQHRVLVEFRNKNFLIQFHYQHNSARETLIANSPQTQLKPFEIIDININYHRMIGAYNFGLGFEILNVLNEQYELLLGYPMPGRTLNCTMQLKL